MSDLTESSEIRAPEQQVAVLAPPEQDNQLRQRQLNLLTILVPMIVGLLVLRIGLGIMIDITTQSSLLSFDFIALVVLGVATLGCGIVMWWLAQKNQIRLAQYLLIATALTAIFTMQMQLNTVSDAHFPVEFSIFFMTYLLVVAVAGAFGGQALIFMTAGITAVCMLISALSYPMQPYGIIIGAAALLQLAIITTIIGFTDGNYNRALDDLNIVKQDYERTKQLDDLKALFITSVNHELRNPVMAMLGYLELLQIPRNRTTPDRLDFLVREANKAGQNMRALLNSILETRRLDQGAHDFTPVVVNVHDEVENAMRLIDPREASLNNRDLRIRVPTNLTIWGDPVHLQQILMNLISNAIKYSHQGTPVDVSAMRVVDTSFVTGRWGGRSAVVREMTEIVVHDRGFGIPPGQIPLLFQRFSRLPRDLASKIIGNGLGLHLCRVFTEAMGGRIWVESAGIDGKGSTFHVRLPLPPLSKSTLLDVPDESYLNNSSVGANSTPRHLTANSDAAPSRETQPLVDSSVNARESTTSTPTRRRPSESEPETTTNAASLHSDEQMAEPTASDEEETQPRMQSVKAALLNGQSGGDI